MKWDGFRISGNDDGITIRSNEPRGILYGAYQFLEDAGCSFVYPGRDEEVVARKEQVLPARGDRVFNPRLEYRGLTPYGLDSSSLALGRNFIDWMAKNKFNYIMVSENRPSDSPGNAHGNVWKDVSGKLLPELQKARFRHRDE